MKKRERLLPRVINSLFQGKTYILVWCCMTSCLGMHVICSCLCPSKDSNLKLFDLIELKYEVFDRIMARINLKWIECEKNKEKSLIFYSSTDVGSTIVRSQSLFGWSNAHLPQINRQSKWFSHDRIKHGAWASLVRFSIDNEPQS